MKYIDLHCDALTAEGVASVTMESLRAGGCALQCFAAFVNGGKGEGYARALSLCDAFDEMCAREGFSRLPRTDGGVCAVLTVEGGEAIEGDLEKLEALSRRGVKIFGLTWNYPNEIGECATPHPTLPPYKGGRQEGRAACGGEAHLHSRRPLLPRHPEEALRPKDPEVRSPTPTPSKGAGMMQRDPNSRRVLCGGEGVSFGLTPFGRECVARMCELNMLPDVSHGSDALLREVAAVCKEKGAPFVASHSNARAVYFHPRNLTDEGIRLIAESGGVVGLNFYDGFLSDDKTSAGQKAALFSHARHILKRGGEDVLALGTDFDGAPPSPYVGDPSAMPRFLSGLEKTFGARIAEKIAFKNAARVLGAQ